MTDDLATRFAMPDRRFGPTPFWWWSGERVTPRRACAQLNALAEGGVRNVVIINLAPAGPAFGAPADDPPWFSDEWWRLFRAVCFEARRLGVAIWFYDQLGFSAANVQGRVLAREPSYRGSHLQRIGISVRRGARIEAPAGTTAVAAVAIPTGTDSPVPLALKGNGAEWPGPSPAHLTLAFAARSGFDYLSPEACRALFDYVHGEFDRRAADLLGDPIVGSFQDELPRLNTWTDGFAEAFEDRNGYSLLRHVNALWEGSGSDADRVRFDCHSTRSALAESAFFEPLYRWHEERGLQIGCDQQTPAREADPVGGAQLYGDYATAARWFHAPGSDHWGDGKFHSSIAHAHRQPRVWIEGFHSTGWGATLEETFDWLLPWLRAGATLFNPHAVYYATREGWFEWAPPSSCWRQPYWRHYRTFSEALERLCSVLSFGTHCCDVAVLYPSATVLSGLLLDRPLDPFRTRESPSAYRQLVGSTSWMHGFRGVLESDSRDFDVLVDASVAEATVADGRLHVADEAYRCVILPALRYLAAETAEVLEQFAESGGLVIAVGTVPERVAGSTRDTGAVGRLAKLASFVTTVADVPRVLTPLKKDVDSAVPFVRRSTNEADVILFCRPSRTHVEGGTGPLTSSYAFDDHFDGPSVQARVRNVRGVPELWDIFSGKRRRLDHQRVDDETVEIEVPFEEGPAALVVWSETRHAAERIEPGTLTKISLPDTGWACKPGEDPTLAVWELQNKGHGARPTVCDRVLVHGPAVARDLPAFATSATKLDNAGWTPHAYSLRDGIPNDPFHIGQFGPKGYVPEEFIRVPNPGDGEGVQIRTLALAAGPEDAWLRIGAAADKEARWNGHALETSPGYWLEVPIRVEAGPNLLEVRLSSSSASSPSPLIGGPTQLGMTWSVVRTPELHRRPEWIRAKIARPSTFAAKFAADSERATMHVGSESRVTIRLNGARIGEQGEHNTYVGMGFRPQFVRYDLNLAPGENTIEVDSVDGGPLYVDIAGQSRSLCCTNDAWSATTARERTTAITVPIAWRDPRSGLAWRRPHPLPLAEEIEGAQTPHASDVVSLIPTTSTEAQIVQLECPLPPGARQITLETAGPTIVEADGITASFDRHATVELPTRPRSCRITIEAPAGYSGGAALIRPPLVEFEGDDVSLGDWARNGLAGFSGLLVYSRDLEIPETEQVELDLGCVRGTAEVRLNGRHVGTRFCGPWMFNLWPHVSVGSNQLEVLVCNTLGPRLGAQGPTRLGSEGQRSSGLLGPVTLRLRGAADVV